jgi:hypothetical protein
MRILRFFIPYVIIFFTKVSSQNCNCIPLGPFVAKDVDHYAVIFQCDVKSVEVIDGVGKATVIINKLYKGKVGSTIQLQFKNTAECPIVMQSGERWLIYGEYYQVQTILMEACSRSRKFFRDVKADYYAINTGQTFDEEIETLRSVTGVLPITDSQISSRELIKPKGTTLIVLIGFSLVGFLMIWFILKRFLK